METNNPTKAMIEENRIPTGPATRLIQKGGRHPPRETTIGFSNTFGISSRETIRLKTRAIGGMNFTILLEINENNGIEKAAPKGTAMRSTGFTIFALLSFEDLMFHNVGII